MSPEILDLPGTTSAFATIDVHLLRADAMAGAEVWPEQAAPGHPPDRMTSASLFATWYDQADQSIGKLALLEEDWDSYGGAPIDPDAIANAHRILRSLATVDGVPAPSVGAVPDGEVGLAWDVGDWSLDLTIDASAYVHYVYLDRRNPEREAERRVRNLDEVIMLLTQPPRR